MQLTLQQQNDGADGAIEKDASVAQWIRASHYE